MEEAELGEVDECALIASQCLAVSVESSRCQPAAEITLFAAEDAHRYHISYI